MKKQRVRKPRDTKDFYAVTHRLKGMIALYQHDTGDSVRLILRDSKRLHAWLGKVIAYLESKEEK